MQEVESVVIRFSGDSGDGMQVTGAQFSNTSALMGNDIATFPDFPAEIRAPQGTVAGVSGFQIHFGSNQILTPGDDPDVLVAMNPAALKANLKDLRPGGTIIVNLDTFTTANLEKAGFDVNPLHDGSLDGLKIIEAPITSQTKLALESLELDAKSKLRCKNFYALGMTYFLYTRSLDTTVEWIRQKFKNDPLLVDANITALKAGYHYAETIEAFADNYHIAKAKIEKGTYRQINGNTALAWGFIYAAQNANLELFLGSYPITPASDVLHELSKHKAFGVKTFQAEDEIAAISSALGASFAGGLGLTTSSGPGIALKSEALNLAVVLELPLIVVDIQRGGPSTGLPTKTEQSDLNMVMHGRNGESPLIVLAACSPSDCFKMAFEAARLSLEHMTPVVLLSDGYIANGSEPWKIPNLDKEFPKIKTKLVDVSKKPEKYLAYHRDEKLVRPWAIPGMAGFEHRLGGLEKQENTGNVSYDPVNHQNMVNIRAQKVANISDGLSPQEIFGDETGDILVVSWGGTYGATFTAVKALREKGKKISLMHMKYLNPMPKNVASIFKGFKRIVVCELNKGQLKDLLNARFHCHAEGYNKVQGQPFKVRELVQMLEMKLNIH